MRIPYPNRDRSLRQLHRTRAVYQYGRFPQRYVLGMQESKPQHYIGAPTWCCNQAFLTLGKEHAGCTRTR